MGFRFVARLVHVAHASTQGEGLPRHERILVALHSALALLVCRMGEKHRHSVSDSSALRLRAFAARVGARVLVSIERLAVRDRGAFLRGLRAGVTRAFEDAVRLEIPLVVVAVLWNGQRGTFVHTTCVNFGFLYMLAGAHVRFLVSAYWMKWRSLFSLHRTLAWLADPFEGSDRAVWLGNSPAEVRAAEREGCATVAVNNNCFVNEDCFPLLTPASAPTFDAVLNANAGSWKRHELARDIEALAYITYSKGPDGSLVWPVASFAPLWRNKAYLSESDRRKVYADAVCGLALSACEGANYATVEFLLSGMPIVSTPSIGGRAEWLDAENSIVCAPTPEAVATAVRTWRDRHNAGQIDHMAIRSRCLERMGEHRERFISTLQAMLDQVGEPASASELFADLKATDTMMHSLSFQQGVGPKAHPFCNGKGWYDLTTLPDELAPRP